MHVLYVFHKVQVFRMIKVDGCHRGIGSWCGLDLYSLTLYQYWNGRLQELLVTFLIVLSHMSCSSRELDKMVC